MAAGLPAERKPRRKSKVKDFPLDFESIPQDALGPWFEDFSLPLDPLEIFKMSLAIKEAHFDCIRRRQGTFAGELLLAEIKLYLDFSPVLCGLHLMDVLRDQGLAPKYSPRSPLAAFDSGIFPEKEPPPPPDSLMESFRRRLRTIIYNARVNKSPLYFLNAGDEFGLLYNIQPTSDSIAYASNARRSFRYADKNEWLAGWRDMPLSADVLDEISKASGDAAQSMIDAAITYGLKLSAANADTVKGMILARLTECAKQYETLKRRLARRGSRIHLLGANQAPSFSRLFSLCVNAAGGMTTSFNHGYDPTRSRDLRIETSIARRFVTYTKGGCREAAKSFAKFKPLTSKPDPELISLDSSLYRKLWTDSHSTPPPDRIRNVILPGYPYDSLYNMMWGLPELSLLHLEMRIATVLRDAGFNVLYKAHPDGLFKYKELIPGVPVCRDRFEEVMHRADAFVFSYHATSVLPLALATNRRMAIVQSCHLLDDYAPDTLELFDRRCKVLTPSVDAKNRLAFDEKALLEHLSAPHSEPDMDLLRFLMDIP